MNNYQESKFKWILFDIFDIVAFLVFVIWLVLFIRFFIFNPYSVVWQSMEPNVHEKDFLIIDKITPTRWELERWDVIVFVPEKKTTPFIKRVVWLPWETVKFSSGNIDICKNDENWNEICNPLEQDYLPEDRQNTVIGCSSVYDGVYKVTDWYFVMWDNRDHSTDSRCCFSIGCYSNSNYLARQWDIIWKLIIRLYPFNSIKTF